MSGRFWMILSLLCVCVFATSVLYFSPEPEPLSIPAPKETRNVIEDALAATVRISWRDAGVTTGAIVGRRPITGVEEMTQYFVLTAQHSIRSVDTETLECGFLGVSMLAWIDPNREPIEVTNTVEIYTSLPVADILVVTFDSELNLRTIPFASDLYIDNEMHIGDSLYFIGCDAGNLPVTRKGVLAAKASVTPRYNEITPSQRFPGAYFCPSLCVWPGASGGPVINTRGEYIGMMLLVDLDWRRIRKRIVTEVVHFDTNVYLRLPVPHIPTAIKSGTIRHWLATVNALEALNQVVEVR